MTFFQYLTICVFTLFMGIMVFVTVTAYTRQSGSTGQNMAEIQKLRFERKKEKV